MLNDFPVPRFIVYIDTPIEDCLERIDSRDNGRELFEKQEFLAKVKDNYELIFADLPEGVVFQRIDGRKSKEDITATIQALLKEHSLL